MMDLFILFLQVLGGLILFLAILVYIEDRMGWRE